MRALLIAFVISGMGGVAAARGAMSPPAELITVFTPGAPGSLDGLRDFANAMKPGSGMMINDALIVPALAAEVGLTGAGGIDTTSPLYLAYVDGGGAKGWVLIAKADQTKLDTTASTSVAADSGWVVVGKAAAVKKISKYALATFPTQAAPTAPTATLYVTQVLARYKNEIKNAQAAAIASMSAQNNMMSGLAQSYVDGLLAAAADTDRVVVTLEADKASAALELVLWPRFKTRLDKFVKTQHASDYAMLDKLPASTSAWIAIAGHIEAGPYRQGMLELASRMYGAGAPPELVKFFDNLMKASTAELAMTMGIGKNGMSLEYVFGVEDQKSLDTTLAKFFDLIAKPKTIDVLGIPTTLQTDPGASDHDGVSLRSYSTTYDLSKVPATQAAAMKQMVGGGTIHTIIGSFDQLGFMTQGADAAADAGRTIDAARGKGTHYAAPADAKDLLAASRARKDSIVMLMDFGAFAAMNPAMAATKVKVKGSMLMTVGFADGGLHLRMVLPAATAKSFTP
ncbi:MAG TPA: hypothetical protein VL463_07585 [Kofleriaceae bacterium]|nr:hypothetical protein [Kofleriaceae bacterium]